MENAPLCYSIPAGTKAEHCIQSLPVELVEITQVVFHLHGHLLPRVEAQIPQLQQRLVFRVVDPLDNTDDFPLQIHQRIYVLVDLVFQINDFDNDILHGLHIPAPAGRVSDKVEVALVAKARRLATCSSLLLIRWSMR